MAKSDATTKSSTKPDCLIATTYDPETYAKIVRYAIEDDRKLPEAVRRIVRKGIEAMGL